MKLKYSVLFGQTAGKLTAAVGNLLGSYYVTSYNVHVHTARIGNVCKIIL